MNVIAFPVERQVNMVRYAARQLERRAGAQALKFWKTECARLYGRLKVIGLMEEDILREVDCFSMAVHREMQRAAYEHEQRGQGGDAA